MVRSDAIAPIKSSCAANWWIISGNGPSSEAEECSAKGIVGCGSSSTAEDSGSDGSGSVDGGWCAGRSACWAPDCRQSEETAAAL